MKKYLITTGQLDAILIALGAADYPNLKEEVMSLRPIESLTDGAIYEIIKASTNVEGKYMLPFSFAHEIESIILGETK